MWAFTVDDVRDLEETLKSAREASLLEGEPLYETAVTRYGMVDVYPNGEVRSHGEVVYVLSAKAYPSGARLYSSEDAHMFGHDRLSDDDGPEGLEDPWRLARRAGINVLSNMELLAYIADPDVGLIAAVWNAITSRQEYSFDVAVAPEFQGLGFGGALIDLALEDAAYSGCTLELNVVNPLAYDMLERRGWRPGGG